MNVSIERADCISCGLCVSTCPDVFQFGEDSRAQVHSQPGPELEDTVLACAEDCPVSVIYVSEETGKEA